MADRYQNGLLLRTSSAFGGRVLSKWIYEFCTQAHGGWTAYDDDDALWTGTEATGTNGASVTSEPGQLDITGDGYSFTAGVDEDRFLTITGMTPAERDGIYRIERVISSKIVQLDIKQGVHESGIPSGQSGLSWRLWSPASGDLPATGSFAVLRAPYSTTPAEPNFDIRLETQDTGSLFGLPSMQLGPYGTWDSGGNTWSDARNTSEQAPANPAASMTETLVWGHVSDNRVVVFFQPIKPQDFGPNFMYLGEFNPRYPAVDTNPSIIWRGANQQGIGVAAYNNVYGPQHIVSGTNYISEGIQGLGGDDATTVNYRVATECTADGDNNHYLRGISRRYSQFSRNFYRLEIELESVTASFMELRGQPQGLWVTGQDNAHMMPFGNSLEYLHLAGGLAIPWNGSRVLVQL